MPNTSSAVPAFERTVPCTLVSRASFFMRVTGKLAFTTTSPSIRASDTSCTIPILAGVVGLYTVLYPIEDIFTIWFTDVASSLNKPSSPLMVPLTNAESGRNSSTTLAYGNGWLLSSTSFPFTVCADTLIGSNMLTTSMTKYIFIFFIDISYWHTLNLLFFPFIRSVTWGFENCVT